MNKQQENIVYHITAQPLTKRLVESSKKDQQQTVILQTSFIQMNHTLTQEEYRSYVFLQNHKKVLEDGIKDSQSKNNSHSSIFRNTAFSKKHISIRVKLVNLINDISEKMLQKQIDNSQSLEQLRNAFVDAIKESTLLYRSTLIKDLRKLSLKTADGKKACIDDFKADDIGIKVATSQHFVLKKVFQGLFSLDELPQEKITFRSKSYS